jgi:hypothetical protein
MAKSVGGTSPGESNPLEGVDVNAVNWEAVVVDDVEAYKGGTAYTVDLQQIAGLSDEVKDRVLRAIEGKSGSVDAANTAIADRMSSNPDFERRFSAGRREAVMAVVMDLYGDLFRTAKKTASGRSGGAGSPEGTSGGSGSPSGTGATSGTGGVGGVEGGAGGTSGGTGSPDGTEATSGAGAVIEAEVVPEEPASEVIIEAEVVPEEPASEVVIDAEVVPESHESLYDHLNRVLKDAVTRKTKPDGSPDEAGEPDLSKRIDLQVAVARLEQVAATDGRTREAVLTDVTKSVSVKEFRARERAMEETERVVINLDAAGKYLQKDPGKSSIVALIANLGDEKLDDKSGEIRRLEGQIEGVKLQLESLKGVSGGGGAEQSRLLGADGKPIKGSDTLGSERESLGKERRELNDKLGVAKEAQGKFDRRVEAVKKLKTALDELFEHLRVLAKTGCLTEQEKAEVERQDRELAKVDLPIQYQKLVEVFNGAAGGSTGGSGGVKSIVTDPRRTELLTVIDTKYGELSVKARDEKRAYERAKKATEANVNLSDPDFALKVIKFQLLKDPENAKLPPEELDNLAKRHLLDDVLTLRSGQRLGATVAGAPGNLLDVMGEVGLKEKIFEFSYRIGNGVVRPFEGLTPADFRSRDAIERLFMTGRMNVRGAFFALVAMERFNGATSEQYVCIREKILEFLAEKGVDRAKAVKLFEEQKKRIVMIMDEYYAKEHERAHLKQELRERKYDMLKERWKRGELSHLELQHELEDAGVFRDGKLDESSTSWLGLFGSYLWNSKGAQWVRNKTTDIAKSTGKWLGWNLALAPALTMAQWTLKGGVALAGSAVAMPFRLAGYPLALLKAPWHVLKNPLRVLSKPGEVFSEAGKKVKDTWTGKLKAGTERRAKMVENAKAAVKGAKANFRSYKMEWGPSYAQRADADPDRNLVKMEGAIKRLQEELTTKGGVYVKEDPFIDVFKGSDTVHDIHEKKGHLHVVSPGSDSGGGDHGGGHGGGSGGGGKESGDHDAGGGKKGHGEKNGHDKKPDASATGKKEGDSGHDVHGEKKRGHEAAGHGEKGHETAAGGAAHEHKKAA